MSEHHQIDCTPFGFTAREKVLYRKRDYQPNYDRLYWFAAVLFFLSALLFFVTTVFHLTDVASASTGLDYREVHTEHEACVWLHQHPGAVKNVKWCNL